MPIDSSIYSQIQQPQIESPINAMAKVAQLQNAQNQNKLFSMQAQDAEEARAGKNALAAAYKSGFDPVTGQLDRQKLITGLAQGGQGAQIPGIQKTFNEQDKAQREADKAKLESVKQHIDLQGQLLGGVKDQNSWTQALQIAQQNGIDVSKFPQQYDPATVQQLQQRALSAKDQIDQQWKSKGYDLERQKVGISAANLGLARERLAYDKGQPKGQYDASSGMLVDTRTGTARPVTGPDGQPIVTGGGKPLTDTQAKALQFGSRMQNADKILNDLDAKGVSVSVPGSRAGYGIGSVVNALQPEERQQLDQAKRDFINAVLRRESGAAISPSEFESAEKQYFPQAGEGNAIKEQKRHAREISMRGILAEVPNAETRVGKVLGKSAKPSLDDIFK